ncbi:hypothetical protein MVEN_00196100 [Mycena venus]|uniref:Uncharacterized protein n=1 Tax=Mycena venus TaxID=2733690 RepID=A0A8H6Z0G5_9AGAR|nr:hypothetical protein MVEN_00196100 [Mycena venus]
MRDFAQELVDLVIDNVAATTIATDIGNCGRVCRHWFPRSRIHLFSHLTLTNAGSANIESFLNIIDGSFVPILSLVHTLHIRIVVHSPRPSDQHMTRLRNLPNLKELRMHGQTVDSSNFLQEVQFFSLVDSYVLSVGTGCTSLTRFDLVLPTTLSIHVLADVLSSLPFLRELRLSPENYGAGIVDPATFPTPTEGIVDRKTAPRTDAFPPHLHTLDIELYVGASLLFRWLLSLPEPPILTSLTIKASESLESHGPVETYLRRFGAHTESLTLAYHLEDRFSGYLIEDTRALEARIFRFTPRLVKLELSMQQSETIPTILLLLPSAHLTTLKVGVCINVGTREPDWSAIDKVVSRFGTLLRLSVTDQRLGHSIITTEAMGLMPNARARNILVLNVV